MKKSRRTLRKILVVALAAVMIGGTGLTTTVGSFVGTTITADAASAEIVTYGDFTYYLYSTIQ